MTVVDPRPHFPEFYENPAIATLASAPRWTVSATLAENIDDPDDPKATRKAPIDMRQLLDGTDVKGRRLRGAWSRDEQCLVTLDELSDRMPAAANTAFYLQAATDGLVVIDIEPGCPPEVAADLLALPGMIYTEESMSGRGYHLVAPLPSNFSRFPIAAGKKVLRHEKGWYEILIEHWITFTRRPIRSVPDAPETAEFTSVEDLYTALAEKARRSAAAALDVHTAVELPNIPHRDRIVTKIVALATHRMKTPEDFDHDLSRYEFSVLGTLYHQMLGVIVSYMQFENLRFSTSDQAWLLYQAATEILEPRPKHNERRNGRPFLLDRAAAMIAGQQSRQSAQRQ